MIPARTPEDADKVDAAARRVEGSTRRAAASTTLLSLERDADGHLCVRVLPGVGIEPDLVRGHGVSASPAEIDTSSGAGRSLQAPIFKAVGVRHGERPRVLDCTAGLGSDAWLLAAAGCQVACVERQSMVHALLEDGLKRARTTKPEIAARLTLLPCQPSLTALENWRQDWQPESVYLDPMFPGTRKTAEKKAMKVLRLLAGDDADDDALLAPARALALRRVVVKRPSQAPHLNGVKPSLVFEGKGFRFDVYLK